MGVAGSKLIMVFVFIFLLVFGPLAIIKGLIDGDVGMLITGTSLLLGMALIAVVFSVKE